MPEYSRKCGIIHALIPFSHTAMQNEIELKIMLREENIPLVQDWLNQQSVLEKAEMLLGNTYFDTPEQFFAQHQMGLRVRSQNGKHELTLKMKGEIIGGLHSRPEYNLPLPDATPDFKRLVSTYNLQIDHAELIAEQLQATFSTDFARQIWLIKSNETEIEVALDRGRIKNPFGEEAICELEFELKRGDTAQLFALLEMMPKQDGMWLSSLSKAQRGYLVGRTDKIAKEIEKLTACTEVELEARQYYQREQQLADLLRLFPENPALLAAFARFNPNAVELCSAAYLRENLTRLKQFV